MEHDAFLPQNEEHHAQPDDVKEADDGTSKHGYQPVHQSYQSHQSSPLMQTQVPLDNMAYPSVEDHQDPRPDPYRSAYSQQQQYQQQHLSHGAFSPYHESQRLSEEANLTPYDSRQSFNSSNGTYAGGQRYPMQALPSQGSNQPMSRSYHQQTGTTPASSEFGGQSDRYRDHTNGSAMGLTTHQPSATQDRFKQEAEEDEDAEILRKLSRSGARSYRSNSGQSMNGKKPGGGKKKKSPGFSFESVAALGPPVVSGNQFQEPFSLQMRVDSRENYLPVKFTSIEMNVWLKIDQTKIGNNDNLPSRFVIKPKTVQVISVPMMLDYTSLKIDTNADGTLQELISACKPVDLNSGTIVQGINLTFGGKLKVWGLSWVWKPEFSFNVDSVPCPINARDPSAEPVVVPQPQPQPSSSTGGATTASASRTAPGSSSSQSTPTATGSLASSHIAPTPTA
ncbi:hypothetical protein BGZ54_002602 [Gamsiella multidivaricata]|nr:hypothetical protein BGZ54_002602 [Gamsiella multidivaricata]